MWLPKLKIGWISEVDGTSAAYQKVTAASGTFSGVSVIFSFLSEYADGIAVIIAIVSASIMYCSYRKNKNYVANKNRREQEKSLREQEMHDIELKIKSRELEEL